MFFNKKKNPYPEGIYYVDVNGDKKLFRMRVGDGVTHPDKTPFICDKDGNPIEITIKGPNELSESTPVVEAPKQDVVDTATPDLGALGGLMGMMGGMQNSHFKPLSPDEVFTYNFYTELVNEIVSNVEAGNANKDELLELRELIEKFHPEYMKQMVNEANTDTKE